VNTIHLINYISAASILLPVGVALSRLGRYRRPLNLLVAFFLFTALVELTFLVTCQLKWKNVPLVHLYTVVEIAVLSTFYYHTFSKPRLKKGIALVAMSLITFSILNSAFGQGIWRFNTFSRTLESYWFITLSLMYCYWLLSTQAFIHVDKHPAFWVNIAILFSFSGRVFLFMLQNAIVQDPKPDYIFYWALIQMVVNVMAHVLYTVGLLCKPQSQIYPLS
jgi:hypothetical protein